MQTYYVHEQQGTQQRNQQANRTLCQHLGPWASYRPCSWSGARRNQPAGSKKHLGCNHRTRAHGHWRAQPPGERKQGLGCSRLHSFCRMRDEATQREYQKALRSLSGEWRGIKELPCRIDYYDTLTEVDKLAERRRLPVMRGNHPAGVRVEFRLLPNDHGQGS